MIQQPGPFNGKSPYTFPEPKQSSPTGDIWTHPDLARVLFSPTQIAERVTQLGYGITEFYRGLNDGRTVLVAGVFRGAVCFLGDLIRAIKLDDLEVDAMAVSSYEGTASTRQLHTVFGLHTKLSDRYHLLLVEDIVDTGFTGEELVRDARVAGKETHPASVHMVALLNKGANRKNGFTADWNGFECPNEFVVGYGLDYNGRYRNLPGIGVLKPELYTN
jgi:hypoxanthine phosphoribosyltransferase